MKRWVKFLGPVVVTSVMLVGHVPRAGAHGGGTCRRVAGRVDTNVVACAPGTSPVGLCTQGTMTGLLNGTLDFAATSLVPSGDPNLPTVAFYLGQTEITNWRGTLSAVDSGVFDTGPSGDFTQLLTFTGGTGAYANAYGRLTISGQCNLATGVCESWYRGQICGVSSGRGR